MTRLCTVVLAAAIALGGCAAADPTGGLLGEPDGELQASQRSRSSCPAGELLTCELKSPNRVSDGRYGFRGGRSKRCYCQPERDVIGVRGGRSTLPLESPR
ncbi:MAG: hypothetical protein AAF417_04260 [Pseudomonadota bacterium]